MPLRPEEISKIIKSQIKHYEQKIDQSETGSVLLIGDGIARVSGLEKCMANELVRFANGSYGMALNLEENSVAVVMLGSDEGVEEGGFLPGPQLCDPKFYSHRNRRSQKTAS